MADIYETDPHKKVAQAQADPVMALRVARQRYTTSWLAHNAVRYDELAVAYVAHEMIYDDPEKWTEFAKVAHDASYDVPRHAVLPASLMAVVGWVFNGQHSKNRIHKYARCLEYMHHCKVDPADALARIKKLKIEGLYKLATEHHPRRAKDNETVDDHSAVSGAADNSPDDVSTVEGRNKRPSVKPAKVGNNADDKIASVAPAVRFDTKDTLLIEINAKLLEHVLRTQKGQKGRLIIQRTRKEADGWKVFVARRYRQLER